MLSGTVTMTALDFTIHLSFSVDEGSGRLPMLELFHSQNHYPEISKILSSWIWM